MTKPTVFVARRIPDAGLDKLAAVCDLDVWPEPLPPSAAVLREKAAGVDALLSLLTDRVDAALLDAAPRLKVVANFAVGYNNIDVAAATARGLPVGNTPGVLTDATADIAVTLLLAAARRLVESDAYARSGAWKTWEPLGHIGVDLVGKTVGVFGMGRIGFAFARRMHFGWNMPVVYTANRDHAEADEQLGARRVDFDELLATADFVSVHASYNPSTHHVFDAAVFAKMKPSAVFVNTARGALHQQADLVAALKSKTIFAAGLDVTDPEPPDPSDELLTLSNLVIAPHIASATRATRDAMALRAADNILAALRGDRLPYCVNPEVYGA
ncbi:MAG: 2-hydroxyacid dehydrogenase [Planctomycetia bacterium]